MQSASANSCSVILFKSQPFWILVKQGSYKRCNPVFILPLKCLEFIHVLFINVILFFFFSLFFFQWKIIFIETPLTIQSVTDIKLLLPFQFVLFKWSHEFFFSSTVWKQPWLHLEVVSINLRSISSRAHTLVCNSKDNIIIS